MGLQIQLVPHPGRRDVTTADGRKIHVCATCKDDAGEPNAVVEPRGHLQWQAVPCDRCGAPCTVKRVPFIHDLLGIAFEGVVVGLCHNGPNGFISPTVRNLDASIWHAIKRYVDAKLGGSAKLNDVPPPFEPLPTDDDDIEEEPEPEIAEEHPWR